MTLRQHHASLNLQTRSLRDTYTNHRNQIMRLIIVRQIIMRLLNASNLASGTNANRIAVLGAGNCNDINLPWLTQKFDEVHLVDLDSEAIRFATSGKNVGQNQVYLHHPIDVAVLQRTNDFKDQPPSK